MPAAEEFRAGPVLRAPAAQRVLSWLAAHRRSGVPPGPEDLGAPPAVAQLRVGRIVLGLLSGSGELTRALEHERVRCGPAFDLQRGCQYDLTLRASQDAVLALIHPGRVCPSGATVISCARKNIKNFEKARAQEKIGLELSLFAWRSPRRAIGATASGRKRTRSHRSRGASRRLLSLAGGGGGARTLHIDM